jgi:hypothetical protein
MFMRAVLPTVAAAVRLPPGHVTVAYRLLRDAGQISGRGERGSAAPRANPDDVAKLVLALLASERPSRAVAGLELVLPLVTVVDSREQGLAELLTMLLDELVQGGGLGGVTDLRLSVSHPWPAAVLEMYFQGKRGTTKALRRPVVFLHPDTRSADPEADLPALEARFGHVPGATRWASVDLASLTAVADAIAGRDRERESRVAELIRAFEAGATSVRLPSGGEAFHPMAWVPPRDRRRR